MDILLVESDAHCRVRVANLLASNGHRVTLSSSVAEARELLRFIPSDAAAPQAVIISEELLHDDGPDFRQELSASFPATAWIPLARDLDLHWLADWIEKVTRQPERVRRVARRRVAMNVLLIETDDTMRGCMTACLAAKGDDVTSCATVDQAMQILGRMCAGGRPPQAIVAAVALADGNGISFFLAARKRCPDVKWIVSCPPKRPPRQRSKTSGPGPRTTRDVPIGRTRKAV